MFKRSKERIAREPLTFFLTLGAFGLLVFTLLHKLTYSPLWGDEWEEMVISSKSLPNGEMYSSIISTFQPPLYNFVMHFWLMVSHSMLWFRLFNVVLGVVSGVFLYKTVTHLTSRTAAAVSVASLAATYEWVFCMQECSEYALMLTCLFMVIHFFVRLCDDFSVKLLALFSLACGGAMYSQYGAAFVVVPLIVAVPIVGWRMHKKEALVRVAIVFAAAFVLLVIPLYVFFLSQQLGNLEGEGSPVTLTLDMALGYFFTLGQMIGHFLHLEPEGAWWWFWSTASVVLLGLLALTLVKGRLTRAQRSMVLCLLVAYVLHYPLVQLHVYAMVHPDQSYGFFCRYSYFYLPLLATVLPIVASALLVGKRGVVALAGVALACVGIVCLTLSFVALLDNWHKTLDDRFARIWVRHEAWNETTYLLGAHAEDGLRTYVADEPGYSEAWFTHCVTRVDLHNVPHSFWVWHSNWDFNHEGYPELMKYVKRHHGRVTEYASYEDKLDGNNYGMLAHVELP